MWGVEVCGRAGGRWRRDGGGKQRAGEGSTVQIGGWARGGAHGEHEAHGCDAGGVEAQRLVERCRALPQGGHTVRGELRAGGRQARWHRHSVLGRARLYTDRGQGTGTLNMKLVVEKGLRRTQRVHAGGGSDRGG